MSRRSGTGVGYVLGQLIADLPGSTQIRESLALAYWDHVVGPQAAASSDADSVRDGVLFVNTKSSVWSHELTFLRSHIITELNKRIGRPMIREIVFRAKGVKKPASPNELPSRPTSRELRETILPPGDEQEVNQLIASLDSIPDLEIRRRVSNRVVMDRKIRIWMLANGWRACVRCTSLHLTESLICPMCKALENAR